MLKNVLQSNNNATLDNMLSNKNKVGIYCDKNLTKIKMTEQIKNYVKMQQKTEFTDKIVDSIVLNKYSCEEMYHDGSGGTTRNTCTIIDIDTCFGKICFDSTCTYNTNKYCIIEPETSVGNQYNNYLYMTLLGYYECWSYYYNEVILNYKNIGEKIFSKIGCDDQFHKIECDDQTKINIIDLMFFVSDMLTNLSNGITLPIVNRIKRGLTIVKNNLLKKKINYCAILANNGTPLL
jgi:hypothetical protein